MADNGWVVCGNYVRENQAKVGATMVVTDKNAKVADIEATI